MVINRTREATKWGSPSAPMLVNGLVKHSNVILECQGDRQISKDRAKTQLLSPRGAAKGDACYHSGFPAMHSLILSSTGAAQLPVVSQMATAKPVHGCRAPRLVAVPRSPIVKDNLSAVVTTHFSPCYTIT